MVCFRLVLVSIVFCLVISAWPHKGCAQQYMIYSEQCAAGNAKAQEDFKQAQNYRFGIDTSLNFDSAKLKYDEAAANGSVRAYVDLGTMSEELYAAHPDHESYKQEALNYYQKAAGQGCPEALYRLYLWEKQEQSYTKENALSDILLNAANGGAPSAMYELGKYYLGCGNTDPAMSWLKRALNSDCGDAALPYSRHLFKMGSNKEALRALFQGAEAGSLPCLERLAWIYSRGRYNQVHDPAYAECLAEMAKGINRKAPPFPLSDLNKICPPPRLMSY